MTTQELKTFGEAFKKLDDRESTGSKATQEKGRMLKQAMIQGETWKDLRLQNFCRNPRYLDHKREWETIESCKQASDALFNDRSWFIAYNLGKDIKKGYNKIVYDSFHRAMARAYKIAKLINDGTTFNDIKKYAAKVVANSTI